MKKITSLFWFMGIVVLTSVYLLANPTLSTKVGSKLSALWQDISSMVVATELIPGQTGVAEKAEPQEEKVVAEPGQLVKPIPAELHKQAGDAQTESVGHQGENITAAGKNLRQNEQQSRPKESPVPEMGLKDVLISKAETPEAKVNGKAAAPEKDIPLAVLKKIYSKHLEALKILDSGADDERDER